MKKLFILVCVIALQSCGSAQNIPPVNDKIILISNVNHKDLTDVLTGICHMFNTDSVLMEPRLWQLPGDKFAVTFKKDISFNAFYFAVNYLRYPAGLEWKAKVRGWLTAGNADYWITDKSAHKPVMLYIPEINRYNTVYLTTEDNIGYKLGMAVGSTQKELPAPLEKYTAPPVNIAGLKGMRFEDFK